MSMALALAPPGTPSAQLQNSVIARCVRGDRGSASTLNKWMVGEDALSTADDAHYLAATLEYLICNGKVEWLEDRKARSWNQTTIREFIQTKKERLLQDALVGTVSDFGSALLALIARRADCHKRGGIAHFQNVLAGIVRNELLQTLASYTEPAGKVTVLSGATRDWVLGYHGNERLGKKPGPREVERGDFIQYVVPPSPANQLVFGYEVQTELNPLRTQWSDLVSWFPPQIQLAGQALTLLDEALHDEDAYIADGSGECRLQIIGVDLEQLPTTGKPAPTGAKSPHDLYRLTNRIPNWPDGYAEVMSMMTYVRRFAGKRTRAINANMLETKRAGRAPDAAAPELEAVPPLARLYQGSYSVV